MNDFFWTTISCIKGVGSKTLLHLYETYPDLHFDNVEKMRPTMKKASVQKLLVKENIVAAKQRAEHLLNAHAERRIEVIPISNEWYPAYLRLIDDPPPILYVKGNKQLLQEEKTLAIVGTREPTEVGVRSARKIAKTFSGLGYTIVSGLALGIDTAGHEGALEATDGKTIAVLAGNLTEIYPKQNKALADEILEKDGLWVSEVPIGQQNTRGNFVKRDRIQSGLSLGVCPVQTPLKSGTQHTIKFAKDQERFLFTPVPLEDKSEPAIQGNLELMNNGITVLEDKASYEAISKVLLEHKAALEHLHEKRFAEANQPTEEQKQDIEQLNLFDD